MAYESMTFLAASAVAFGIPLLAATAAFAQDPLPAPIVAAAPVAPAAPSDEGASGRVSLRPFLTNAFDKRSVAQRLDTGAPGGGSYVQHVPQAAGLTLKASL